MTSPFSPVPGLPLVLLAHGSRDPRAAMSTEDLALAVAAARPGLDVRVAYLDHSWPSPAEVLTATGPAVVVPLLLTSAYHGRVDVPAALAGHPATQAPVIGPDPALIQALARGLRRDTCDSVLLIAAGTSDRASRAAITGVATALGRRLAVPAAAAFASGPGPRPEEAVAALPGRVGVASYFLAPGLLHDRASQAARAAGAVCVTPPLGAAPELVSLVLTRYAAAAVPALVAA
ncbi:sirohydrochlorin chelatase [Longispora albida]|uniref:sirohydrochlorin chelatase n=1 Tax=Longispora albida TaxID=203523 RepID=UPI0003648B43|nr:sirohydrochlorin chelatase [Longispora albida]